MTVTIFFLLAIGLETIWIAIKNAEEVHKLALSTTGFISLIWGFFLTLDLLQVGLGIVLYQLQKTLLYFDLLFLNIICWSECSLFNNFCYVRSYFSNSPNIALLF